MPRRIKPQSPAPRCADTARPPIQLFHYQPYHRNTPERHLLTDIRSVARLLSTRTLTKSLYAQHGQFHPTALARRFNGWNNALAAAGLRLSPNRLVSANQVLTDIRRVALKLKAKRLTAAQYLTAGKYSLAPITRHFQTWQHAVITAGFAPGRFRAATDSELFDNLEKVWRTLSHQPRSEDLTYPLSKFGYTAYRTRFGTVHQALKAFVQFRPTPNSINTPLAKIKIQRHKTPRTINWRLRFLTLRRDHFRCRACGRSPATDPNIRLQVDHIKPWSHGGETTLENLQSLCYPCNSGKSNLPWKERKSSPLPTPKAHGAAVGIPQNQITTSPIIAQLPRPRNK